MPTDDPTNPGHLRDPLKPTDLGVPTTPDLVPPEHQHPHRERLHEIRVAIVEGAIEGEKDIGRHEATDEEAKEALLKRIGLTIGGVVVITIGILLLPLPGPGWVIIATGFSLLPFAWSRKIVRQIRRRIPGVPEHGTIPTSTWVLGGVLLIGFSLVGLLWGDDIWRWITHLFQSSDKGSSS